MKTNLRTASWVIGLIAVAILAGFVAMMAVIGLANALLPPFQPADDDTLRERIPVALAYLAWGGTTLVILVVGWSWWRREP